MPINIPSAAERLARAPHVNIALFGPSGVGKTYAARTLDPATTLFIDGEAGTLALGNWPGDVLSIREVAEKEGLHPWELARALASLLAGPDHSDYELRPEGRTPGPYSPEMHAAYSQRLGGPAELFGKYRTIFFDSITVASRWSFAWCGAQPEAISDKGKRDTRGVYGLHGQQMMRWLSTLQHAPYSVIVVGILDRQEDELHRVTYSPQIEGGKAGREIGGIFDEVLTLTRFNNVDGSFIHDDKAGAIRGIVTGSNPWGLPGKDRSGALALIEQPDLAAVLAKIQAGVRQDTQPSHMIAAPVTTPESA
jgi:hypothetical protein